jgi:RNA polymerase sigma factor (sigma-70 family)
MNSGYFRFDLFVVEQPQTAARKAHSMSEHELVLLQQFSRTGDAEAFSEITRRYAGLVYGTCLRVTGDVECARDATQETFFQLLKNAGRVSGSLGGWLHQVATRRAVDLVRRDHARRRREEAFAAEAAQSNDGWAEVSPLVDEAMTELEPALRDLLLRHFVQRESTVQMAAAEGVSQPTMSRRVEGALEQLRERLRKKGVGVAAAALGVMMAGAAQDAPAMVLAELGKMALATTGSATASTATATVLGLNVKLAFAAVVIVAGVAGYVAYRETRPAIATRPTTTAAPYVAVAPTPLSEPAATPVGSSTPVTAAPPSAAPVTTSAGSSVPAPIGGVPLSPGPGAVVSPGGSAPGGSMAVVAGGGFAGVGFGPLPTRATTEGALTLFAAALTPRNPARLDQCFAGTSEAEAFRRISDNPTNDIERELQQAFSSVGTLIEIVQTTDADDGLKVKWKATVWRPFTTTNNGVMKAWQSGDRYELETRLKQINGEWKIIGF